jgi:hypothetical protein
MSLLLIASLFAFMLACGHMHIPLPGMSNGGGF